MAATGNEAVTLKQLKSCGSSVLNGGCGIVVETLGGNGT